MKPCSLFLLLALALFIGCEDNSCEVPTNYKWVNAHVEWAVVYTDSIVRKPSCEVDYVFGHRFGECDNIIPQPYEGAWNCTSDYMQRRGDTVFIRAYEATEPDELWYNTFTCLDSYEPFVLQPDGRGLYVGRHDLGQDPELRLEGDTLSFKMTFVLFDRKDLSTLGPVNSAFWVRSHGYGVQHQNLDSIQAFLRSYCEHQSYCLDSSNTGYWAQVELIDRYCPTNTSCISKVVNVDSILAASKPGCIPLNFCNTKWEGNARVMVAWREFQYVAAEIE